MATEEQLDVTRMYSSISAANHWGQRLTITNRTVSKLSFYLYRTGSPTGNLEYYIRSVSDDSTIVSKVYGTAASVPTGPSWVEVTFDTPTFINEEVYILAGGNLSSGAGNVIAVYDANGVDVKASEYMVLRASAVYTNYTGLDFGYIYTFGESGSVAPVVTTQECTNVVAQNALGNGNLQSLGTSAVTQHGHCWHTSTNPTTGNSLAENGPTANKGPFTSPITGLTPGTKYYVRAYATNTTGTSYGANVEIAGDITTIGKRYWWVEGKEFHYFDQYGDERKIEGVPDASGLPWWWYY